MLAHLNNHSQLLIVLHEIYGINAHMEEVCNYYSRQGFDIICPNLLNSETFYNYDQEQMAYVHFMQQVGFTAAASQVKQLTKKARPEYQYVFLLGFSIGATIAWICSEGNTYCDGVVGYYGSRIRDYLDIEPGVPVLLIYPETERFDLGPIQKTLQLKEQVEVYVLPGKHGFCNPFAKDYYESSHKIALEKTDTFVKKFYQG
jgi:dienelactone hydrolase